MKKIFVVGTSGSGKSTLAAHLATKLNLKHIELDALLWLPNWEKRSPDELKRLLELEIAEAKNGYVVDGNFQNKEIQLDAGSVLIFLDYSRLKVFQRILRRSIKRVVTKEKLWAGNQEELNFLLSLNPELNPVLWAWKTHYKRRSAYSALADSLGNDILVYRIRSKSDLQKLIQSLNN